MAINSFPTLKLAIPRIPSEIKIETIVEKQLSYKLPRNIVTGVASNVEIALIPTNEINRKVLEFSKSLASLAELNEFSFDSEEASNSYSLSTFKSKSKVKLSDSNSPKIKLFQDESNNLILKSSSIPLLAKSKSNEKLIASCNTKIMNNKLSDENNVASEYSNSIESVIPSTVENYADVAFT